MIQTYLPGYKGGKGGKRQKYTTTQQQFVKRIAPALYNSMKKYGIYSPAAYDNAIRQLTLESGTGTSRAARQQHNYGGYGWNGKTYTTFKDDQAFTDAYARLLKNRYGDALAATDTLSYATKLYDKGYYRDNKLNRSQNIRNYNRALSGHDAGAVSELARQMAVQNGWGSGNGTDPIQQKLVQPSDNTRVVNTRMGAATPERNLTSQINPAALYDLLSNPETDVSDVYQAMLAAQPYLPTPYLEGGVR